MITCKVYVKTEHGSKYLQQLCKHFAHKVQATYSKTRADVSFPMGPCKMIADADGLEMQFWSDQAEGIEKIKGILQVHLTKFAWREELTFDWQMLDSAATD